MQSQRARARIMGRIVLFVISAVLLFALLCGIGWGVLVLSTRLHGASFPDTYTYKVGLDSTSNARLKSHEYKIGSFGDNQTPYINFTVLVGYCGFYESSDLKEYRYILPNDGSHFIVSDGSCRVDINGNVIYMSAPAVVSDGQLYLPLAFVDRYIEGISIEHQTHTVTDEKTGEKTEVEDEFVYIVRCNEKNEYAFLLEKTEPCPAIDTSALHQ